MKKDIPRLRHALDLLHKTTCNFCNNLIIEKAATKGVFRNFAKFTRTHLCQSLFFNRDPGTGVSCEFCGISKNSFSTEHLRMIASVIDPAELS